LIEKAGRASLLYQKVGIFFSGDRLRITDEIKPGIFDEKRGIAALLIKNSGFYFIFNPEGVV